MREKNLRRLPVIENDVLVGFADWGELSLMLIHLRQQVFLFMK